MDTNDIMFAQLEAEQEAILDYIEEAYKKYATTNIINKAIADCVDKLFVEKFESLKQIILSLQDKKHSLNREIEISREKRWELENKIRDLESKLRQINFNNSILTETKKKYAELEEENENLREKIVENLQNQNKEGDDFSEYDKRLYRALIAGGVDNWEGYELAIESLDEEITKTI